MTVFPSIEKIEEAWGLSKIRLRKLPHHHGGPFIVETSEGERFVLKQVRERISTPELEEIFSALQVMAERQDAHFIARALSLKGSQKAFILQWQGKDFYLVPFIEGRRPSYRKVEDVEIVMRALGLLHKTGQEAGRSLIQKNLGPECSNLWEEFNNRADRYKRALTQLETLNKKWLSYLVQWKRKHFEEQLQMAESIMRSSRKNEVTSNEATTQNNGASSSKKSARDVCVTMCHCDTHQNNYLLKTNAPSTSRTDKDEVPCYLIDVESLRPNFAVADVLVPLHYLGFYSGWKQQAQQRALQAYEQQRPLTETERIFLHANLALPLNWLRAVLSFLKQQGKWNDTGTWRKFLRTIRGAAKHRRFLESMAKHTL